MIEKSVAIVSKVLLHFHRCLPDHGLAVRQGQGKLRSRKADIPGIFPCIGPHVLLPPLYKPALAGNGRQGPETKTMSTGANRILDDFAKLMTDAAGAAQGVRKEMETVFRAQGERLLNSMDIVKREEFEAVREMALKARDENDALLARIAALEARLADAGK
jgi:BMFP domain-containing protein YqiC